MFADTYIRRDIFRCATCDIETEPSEDVDADDDGLPYPPVGWMRLVGDIVTPSEDYLADMADRSQRIEMLIASASEGKEVPPGAEELAQVREFMSNPVQTPLPDGPEHVVERVILCLCPQHVAELQKIGAELTKADA